MQRNSPVGHSPVFVDQARAIADLFAAVGYGKHPVPMLTSILSPATMDLDGAEENANGYTKKFFEEADTVARFTKQQKPLIRAGVMTSNEYMCAILGLEIEVNQQASGFTITEVNEFLEKLLDHVLTVEVGGHEVINDRLKEFIGGGLGLRVSNDAAATPLVARSTIERPGVAFWFPDPIILTPGARIAAKLEGNKTWTSTDDLPLLFSAPAYVGERGAPDEAAKGVVYSLSGAMKQLEAFKAQIDKGA